MDTYAPLFSKIVDSSLWGLEDWVIKIFLTMLAKKDSDFVVRGTAYSISKWTQNKTELEVVEAIKILCSPDMVRVEKQPFDGRRLQRVQDGWLILNAEYYRNLMRSQNRREYNRMKQAEYRRPDYQKKQQRMIAQEPAETHDNGTFDDPPQIMLPDEQPK